MPQESNLEDSVRITVVGRVFDIKAGGPIDGARVIALDENNIAVSDTAFTEKNGEFLLQIPVARGTNGAKAGYKLRADALGYQAFPNRLQTAPSFSISDAIAGAEATDLLHLDSVATQIGLLPVTDGVGSISGKVLSKAPAGTLIVAGTATGIADLKGNYTVFNVPTGEVAVEGYAKGANFKGRNALVKAGKKTKAIDLKVLSVATATVSGSVQIGNAPENSVTSIALSVKETFKEPQMTEDVPPGLRVGGVKGFWSIDKVPNGRYMVLAALENDGLVRHPDPSLGNQIMHVTVSGSDVITEGINLTRALEVIVPGGQGTPVVNGVPRFEWSTESSVDLYVVSLIDAFGNPIWQTELPGSRGASTMFIDYMGPPLSGGMFYQFRAVAIRNGVPSSSTKDQKGVFLYQ
jgi:hypothetical protein